MGSLLEKFAGKIDLICIDPPFATGADFSYTAATERPGRYRVLVKVIDVFGNDTSQAFDVEV